MSDYIEAEEANPERKIAVEKIHSWANSKARNTHVSRVLFYGRVESAMGYLQNTYGIQPWYTASRASKIIRQKGATP